MNEKTTHFGFRDVPVGEKKKLVGEVFTSVAGKYDVMNDLMSLGVHRLWKRYFTGTSGIKRGDRVLDLAGGTGDIAKLLLERVGDTGEIVIGDINREMLGVGRDRLTDLGLVKGLRYVQLNAEALPFPDNSFDAITMAFGLRNVTDKSAALKSITEGGWALQGAVVVLEEAVKAEVTVPEALELLDTREYGVTQVLFLRARSL